MPNRTQDIVRLTTIGAAALGAIGVIIGGSAYVMIHAFAPNPRFRSGIVEKYTCMSGTVLIRGLDDNDNVVRVCVPGSKPIVERDYASE